MLASQTKTKKAELFTLAGYLSPQPHSTGEMEPPHSSRRLDPYVARVLEQEPVDVQRTVVRILTILKSIAKSMTKEGTNMYTLNKFIRRGYYQRMSFLFKITLLLDYLRNELAIQY